MTRGIKIEGRVPELNRMTIRLTVSREDAGYTQPELAKVIDEAIDHAAAELHAAGYSGTDLGRELGVTRQAARQRWGR